MTAPALDLAPTTHRAGAGAAVRGPGAGSRHVRGEARGGRPVGSTKSRTAPAARPVRGSRGPAVAPATRLRPGVRATARSCRGEAPSPARVRHLSGPAVVAQRGWQFTDRALALILGLVLAVVLAAVVAVANTAFAVTSEPTAATAVSGVAAGGADAAASAG